jgi:hypothetical protein
VIDRIGNVHHTRGAYGESIRLVEQRGGAGAIGAAGGGAACAAARERGHPSVRADHADFVVNTVRHKHVARGVHRHACRVVEKRRGARAVCEAAIGEVNTTTREGGDGAVGGHGAHAVIGGVRHVNHAARAHRDRARDVKRGTAAHAVKNARFSGSHGRGVPTARKGGHVAAGGDFADEVVRGIRYKEGA